MPLQPTGTKMATATEQRAIKLVVAGLNFKVR